MTPPDPRVEDVRQRLRSLGYLDAGVDRFVLGSTRAGRRPFALASFASARIGALAAVLLGPSAAIGLTARVPGLVTGPRDALVIALYLSVFFGIVIALAAFLTSLLVLALARRPGLALTRRGQLLSRAAGIIVTLLCLAYLTMWWQTVIAGVGWSSPLWTASALAVAAAISLLLGHVVTVSSLALLVTSGSESSGAVSNEDGWSRRASGSWRTTIGAGAAAFGAAALLLTWSARTPHAQEAPPLTVVASGQRVRVIAIDGFDARVFDELSAAGRVPALTAAFGGARARLDSRPDEAGDPARVWTTIATGQPPGVHGVTRLETRRVAGVLGSVAGDERSPIARAIGGATDLVRLTRPAIASGSERRAKTFWEVAAGAGLRTAVVNWWATWPARDDSGIVLSDRATLRLEVGGPLDAEIAPASLYDALRSRWPALKARATALAGEALTPPAEGSLAALLRRSAELDAMQLALVADVTGRETDLSVVYLPGLDITQHALFGAASSGSDQAGLAASALSARLDALREYYVTLDRLLAPSLTPAADEAVVIITEPGRVTSEQGAQIAARGARLAAGGAPLTGSQADAAPTVLYALGVPVAQDLAGTPLKELFAPTFTARYRVRFVQTYGQPVPRPPGRQGAPLDQEMIDRLRSLGYVR